MTVSKLIPETKERRLYIDQCQLEIWRLKKELKSYSILLQKLSGPIEGEDFHGLGISLKRIFLKLEKINSKLTKIY